MLIGELNQLTGLDAIALAGFLLLLFGQGRFAMWIGGGRNLNALMHQVRRGWMQRMIERPDRIVDAALTGHTVNSLAFFSSTNIIVIAGLFGLLSKAEDAVRVISNWPFVEAMSGDLLELKILGLILVLTYGFFRFTWALRQYNFCCALIGAVPLAKDMHPDGGEIADQISVVLTSALDSFSAGIRCYYFAIAWICWLAGPVALIAATSLIALILFRLQFGSPSAKAVRRYIDLNPPR
jgi:uncharacterized membrane protein